VDPDGTAADLDGIAVGPDMTVVGPDTTVADPGTTTADLDGTTGKRLPFECVRDFRTEKPHLPKPFTGKAGAVLFQCFLTPSTA
jgi:hypothetical protein